MSLNCRQIETLFVFTKEYGVAYYDLQVELVDHLASAIEEDMSRDATLTPDDALQKAFAAFGESGFTHVVKERRKLLVQSNRKHWWKMLKSHFALPKLFLTAAVFTIAFLLSPYLSGVVQGFVIQGIVFSFPFLQLFVVLIKNDWATKNLLLLQQGNNYWVLSFILAFICSPVPSNLLLQNQEIAAISSTSFAGWLTMIFILEHTAFEINNKMRQKARQLYPEAFVKA